MVLGNVGKRRAGGIDGGDEPGFRRMLSDLRRKSTAERLGRSPGSEVQSVLCGCSPSPADGRVVVRSSVLTYSGGTAPASHRTSLLCPSRAPKQGLRYITTLSAPTNRSNLSARMPIAFRLLDFRLQTSLLSQVHAGYVPSDSARSTRWVREGISAAVGARVSTQRSQWNRNDAVCSSSRSSGAEYLYVGWWPFRQGAENEIVFVAATVMSTGVIALPRCCQRVDGETPGHLVNRCAGFVCGRAVDHGRTRTPGRIETAFTPVSSPWWPEAGCDRRHLRRNHVAPSTAPASRRTTGSRCRRDP
jgi:hypothetical protein